MPKIIHYGQDAINKLKIGIDAVANAVKVTLGAKGRNVIIDNPYVDPIVTKDGVTVARHISLKDIVENTGAAMIQNVAKKTVELSGDGTTTATLLAQAIFTEGIKLVTAGVNPMELKKGIDEAVTSVITQLKAQAVPVTDEMLEQVATVAANNDNSIGKLVADMYKKIGKNGVVKIEDSPNNNTEVKQVEGMEINKGYLSPYYISNINKMQAELKNCYILIYDRDITTARELTGILDRALTSVSENRPVPSGKSLLIICNALEGEAFATLNVNRTKSLIPVAAIQCPSYGEHRKELLRDLAILTGGTVISEQDGYVLEKLTVQQFGKCDNITVTKDTTTIIGGKGEPDKIKIRIEELHNAAEQPGLKEIERLNLHERAAKLQGGVAVLYVGGLSTVEIEEKKMRCDDAVRATKAALEEGVVDGGGQALLKCEMIDEDLMDKSDYVAGYDLIVKVLEYPLRQMCINAGVDDGFIVKECQRLNTGYNVATERFEDLFAVGIIDPVKVVRVALEQAASVAGMILTSSVLMVEEMPQQK